ncbi:MAG: LuxR C-terminal-related transcriptional regulator [Coriobacteriales bacterium]|jgi:ATP/maltotriose-dependent transcriptional regulator MalT|nr:LuxR C-terminal-related transcriptional regulator [Coriobacteriales bacterium]
MLNSSVLSRAKFCAPSLPHAHICRDDLLPLLTKGLHWPTIAIIAPAGSGKTILAAEWFYRFANRHFANCDNASLHDANFSNTFMSASTNTITNNFANTSANTENSIENDRIDIGLKPLVSWLSLDTQDNDLARLWQHLIAALTTLCPNTKEFMSELDVRDMRDGRDGRDALFDVHDVRDVRNVQGALFDVHDVRDVQGALFGDAANGTTKVSKSANDNSSSNDAANYKSGANDAANYSNVVKDATYAHQNAKHNQTPSEQFLQMLSNCLFAAHEKNFGVKGILFVDGIDRINKHSASELAHFLSRRMPNALRSVITGTNLPMLKENLRISDSIFDITAAQLNLPLNKAQALIAMLTNDEACKHASKTVSKTANELTNNNNVEKKFPAETLHETTSKIPTEVALAAAPEVVGAAAPEVVGAAAPEVVHESALGTVPYNMLKSYYDSMLAYTQGWIGGIKLATIDCREYGSDLGECLQANAAKTLSAFFSERVLCQIDSKLEEFLLETSILESFCGSLADYVTQNSGSAAIIDKLCSLNLFIKPAPYSTPKQESTSKQESTMFSYKDTGKKYCVNGNTSCNINSNVNDNVNGNMNSNASININSNINSYVNDNVNGNMNSNTNGNINSNANDNKISNKDCPFMTSTVSWYSYHPLFLAWLRNRLFAVHPDILRRINYRASRWYEQNGLLDQSARHLLMAADNNLVAGLAKQAGFSGHIVNTSIMEQVIGRTTTEIRTSPSLSLCTTLAYFISGRPDDCMRWLAIFNQTVAARIDASKSTLEQTLRSTTESITKNSTDDILRSATQCATEETAIALTIKFINVKCRQLKGEFAQTTEQIKTLLSQYSNVIRPELKSVLLHSLAENYEHLGELSVAREYYLQAEAMASISASPFYMTFCRYELAALECLYGRFEQAKEICYRSLKDCPLDYAQYGGFYNILAQIHIAHGQLDNAEKSLRRAFSHLSTSINIDYYLEAATTEANLLFLRGQEDNAYERIVQTTATAESYPPLRGVLFKAYIAHARLALQRNHLDDANKIIYKLESWQAERDTINRIETNILKAAIMLKSDNINDAMSMLTTSFKQCQSLGMIGSALESLLLMSEGHALLVKSSEKRPCGLKSGVVNSGDKRSSDGKSSGISSSKGRVQANGQANALRCVSQALTLASDFQFVSPFLFHYKTIRPLFNELLNARKTSYNLRNFTKSIQRMAESIVAHDATHSSQVASAVVRLSLSERELEVLDLLQMGMTRQEISETLQLSLNTIKTHVKNIFIKLGVNNKVDAIKLLDVSHD